MIVDKLDNKPIILFVCSPSLGILDSWLPVLMVLRDRLPDAHFMFIASKEGTIDQIELDSDLIKMSQKIFDSVIFRSDSGSLLGTKTFKDAENLNNTSKKKIFYYGRKVLNRLKLNTFRKFLDPIYEKIVLNIHSDSLFNPSSIENSKYITLFDISQLEKVYNKELYSLISNSENFSILHGTGIAGVRTMAKENLKKDGVSNTTAYVFSETEIPYYKAAFSLESEQIKVYGIPKHQKNWIEKLANKETISDSRYIFLISRPTNNRITVDRRKDFLEMIKKIAIKHRLKVIIKLHPKEAKGKLFTEVFDADGDKIDWEFSIKHPFTLGKNCEFAVCFYSGVPLDLIHLGVPTIELSNFVGIPEDDNEHSLRNSRGEAVREYRHLDLVLGASTYEEFEKHVLEIMENKEDVVKGLEKSYLKLIPIIENVSELIAQELEESIKNTKKMGKKNLKNIKGKL